MRVSGQRWSSSASIASYSASSAAAACSDPAGTGSVLQRTEPGPEPGDLVGRGFPAGAHAVDHVGGRAVQEVLVGQLRLAAGQLLLRGGEVLAQPAALRREVERARG